jgi:hypothetical protein
LSVALILTVLSWGGSEKEPSQRILEKSAAPGVAKKAEAPTQLSEHTAESVEVEQPEVQAPVQPPATPIALSTETVIGDGDETAAAEGSDSMNPALIEAALLIDRRKCRKAEKKLGQLNLDSARYAYLLGRVNVCRGQDVKALEFYKKAMDMDAKYRADSRILEDVTEMLSANRTQDAALAFLSENLGKTALPTLIQLAGHHKNRKVRHKALAIVEKQGGADHVDMETSLEMDLNQTPSCKERREIVSKLAALNTKAARGVLVRARDAEIKESFFRTRYKHACIRNNIIKALAEMKKK